MYFCPDLDASIVQHLATRLQSVGRKTRGFQIKFKKKTLNLATTTVTKQVENQINISYNLSRNSLEVIYIFFPEINVHIGQLSDGCVIVCVCVFVFHLYKMMIMGQETVDSVLVIFHRPRIFDHKASYSLLVITLPIYLFIYRLIVQVIQPPLNEDSLDRAGPNWRRSELSKWFFSEILLWFDVKTVSATLMRASVHSGLP